MNQLQRYTQRSPRYILLPQDDCLIRVAGPKQVPWEEGTEITDVSTTGLAFTAPEYLSPRLGEHIKLQFMVPGAGQMACYGQVTRIDALSEHRNIIAVKYEYLDLPQQYYLKKGLGKKLRNIEDRNLLSGLDFQPIKTTTMINLFLAAAGLFTLLAIFSHWNYLQIAQYFLTLK